MFNRKPKLPPKTRLVTGWALFARKADKSTVSFPVETKDEALRRQEAERPNFKRCWVQRQSEVVPA